MAVNESFVYLCTWRRSIVSHLDCIDLGHHLTAFDQIVDWQFGQGLDLLFGFGLRVFLRFVLEAFDDWGLLLFRVHRCDRLVIQHQWSFSERRRRWKLFSTSLDIGNFLFDVESKKKKKRKIVERFRLIHLQRPQQQHHLRHYELVDNICNLCPML